MRKVPGSGTITTFGLPAISALPKPPSAEKGLKTMALAVSKKNGAIVISEPLAKADLSAATDSIFPRSRPY